MIFQILEPPPFPVPIITSEWVWPPLYVFDDLLIANYFAILLFFLLLFLCFQCVKKVFAFPLTRAEDTPSPGESNDEIVHLFLFPGNHSTVSSSPFSTKLSLFCRMTGVPHTTQAADFGSNPKGKVPFARHGGKLIPDSQLIIRYLEKTFDLRKMAMAVQAENKVVLNKPFVSYSDLCPSDQALCDFLRITCECEIYWAVVSIRWLGAAGITEKELSWQTTMQLYFSEIPALMRGIICKMIRVIIANDAKGQGFARHSPADQLYLAKRAVKALSTTLGHKEFFLGDFPTEADCIVFGTVQGLADNDTWPNPLSEFVHSDTPNLIQYANRIKQNFFGDIKDWTKHKFPPAIPHTEKAILLKTKEK